MKSRFYFFFGLVVLLLFGNAFAFAAENRSPQSETPFQIFETQVYPFLQQKCAGCHGDNQFDAPQHSPRNDAKTSYQKIRGYVHLAPDWESTSRLITFGGTRHCKEYTGDDSCGADHNELISTVRNWINAEISAKSADPQTPNRSAKTMLQTSPKPNPVTKTQPKHSLKIIQISAGGFHTCALFENGKAKCWGSNAYGQLGIDTFQVVAGENSKSVRSLPYVKVSEPIQQIVAGFTHTCALLRNGKMKCWGANHYGQLGIDLDTETLGRGPRDMETLPFVLIPDSIKEIAVGGNHTCALYENGKAKCWGANNFGQLGIEFASSYFGKDSYKMKRLPDVKIAEPIIKISLGGNYSCAVLQSGKMKCWGVNNFGQLGIDSPTSQIGQIPSEMSSLPDVIFDPADGAILEVSTGFSHACVAFQSGKSKCWGENTHGNLGIGSNKPDVGKNLGDMKSLSSVMINEPIQQIVASISHTCVLLQNQERSAKCWGNNTYGKLGIGISEGNFGSTFEEMKSLPSVLIGKKILQISSINSHTCFLLENNKIKCAGNNSHGQLGTGDTASRGVVDFDGDDELSDVLVTAEEE